MSGLNSVSAAFFQKDLRKIQAKCPFGGIFRTGTEITKFFLPGRVSGISVFSLNFAGELFS
jgi:hypothetical protein